MAVSRLPRATAGWPLPRPRIPLPHGPLSRFLFEVAVIFAGYFSYHLVRGAVNGRADEAFTNADSLIALERSLGIFWEIQFQSMILGHQLLIDFFNGVYIWGHIPVIGAVALWIYFFRREHFARVRNAFLISGAIGLVIFVSLPTAPPRFIVEAGFVDTVTLHNSAYRVLQPPAFVNQYAALPSLHFGWNLLMAVAIYQTWRTWYARSFAVLMPTLMLAGIVLTGNHYILDAILGGVIALCALWIASLLNRRFAGTPIHEVLV